MAHLPHFQPRHTHPLSDGTVDLLAAAPSPAGFWAAMGACAAAGLAAMWAWSPAAGLAMVAAVFAVSLLRTRQLAVHLEAQLAHALETGVLEVRVRDPRADGFLAHHAPVARLKVRGGRLQVADHLAPFELSRLRVDFARRTTSLVFEGHELALNLFYRDDPGMLWAASLNRQLFDALVAMGVPPAAAPRAGRR